MLLHNNMKQANLMSLHVQQQTLKLQQMAEAASASQQENINAANTENLSHKRITGKTQSPLMRTNKPPPSKSGTGNVNSANNVNSASNSNNSIVSSGNMMLPPQNQRINMKTATPSNGSYSGGGARPTSVSAANMKKQSNYPN